jgi:cyclopropane fatty-acyl-phospholipid synthase-like methyltransferase
MLKLGKVGKDDLLYDLGSGDGRIVITAAKTYGTRGIGIDINPERINEANENARKAGVGLTQKLSKTFIPLCSLLLCGSLIDSDYTEEIFCYTTH